MRVQAVVLLVLALAAAGASAMDYILCGMLAGKRVS